LRPEEVQWLWLKQFSALGTGLRRFSFVTTAGYTEPFNGECRETKY
jgi:hypothetical protein